LANSKFEFHSTLCQKKMGKFKKAVELVFFLGGPTQNWYSVTKAIPAEVTPAEVTPSVVGQILPLFHR
jgi:hypothetical protein